MNFADYVKNHSKQIGEELGRQQAEDAYLNWKKPLSISELADTIKEVCVELTEESKDPTFILTGMVVTMGIIDKLFPEEELRQYVESQEGENNGSK